MKISIKTLKGEVFSIEGETTDTVSQLKDKIAAVRPDGPADRQKLIYAGKVLKDTDTVSEINLKDSDFLVCMIGKEPAKPKPAAPVAAPTPVAAPAPAPAPVPVTPAATSTAASSTPASAVLAQSSPAVNNEALASLTAMGFPEALCREALAAANGNPDIAYDFLTNGIPPAALRRQAPSHRSAPAPAPATGGALDRLRRHPQFQSLQQLVQQNPATLPQVLNLIGQQDPQLLEAIHANHDEFERMMNEPIGSVPTPPAAAAPPAPAMGGADSQDGAANAAAFAAMLQNLPPEQRAGLAASMGMPPAQLEQLMQLLSSIPPEQFEGFLSGSMGEGAGGTQIEMTQQDMEAVERLMSLGFSQEDVIQAYLACDRNEEMAANLLFDSDGNMQFDEGYEDEA